MKQHPGYTYEKGCNCHHQTFCPDLTFAGYCDDVPQFEYNPTPLNKLAGRTIRRFEVIDANKVILHLDDGRRLEVASKRFGLAMALCKDETTTETKTRRETLL